MVSSSVIETDVRTSKSVLCDPIAEVAGEVDQVGTVHLARTVLLFHKFRYEVIANQWSKVGIAHGCILSLGDVDVFFFLFLFGLRLLLGRSVLLFLHLFPFLDHFFSLYFLLLLLFNH